MYKVNVYYSTRVIDLTMPILGVAHWNLPMNDYTFRLYKGSKNSIEVVVRNNDRKPVNLTGRHLIVTISDIDTYEVLSQKPIDVRDAYAGSALLTLSSYEIDDWPLGFLRYTVMMQHEDSSQSMLYVDQDEGASGYLELLEGPNLGPINSLSCNAFIPVLNNNNGLTYFYSTSFPGNAQIDRHNYNLMTIAIYTSNWTGVLFIEGCLEDESPTATSPWFPISIAGQNVMALINHTGITPLSFEASLRWVRLGYSTDTSNIGTFDRILYRN